MRAVYNMYSVLLLFGVRIAMSHYLAMADYTVMGAGPAENLLLLSRTVSLEPETGDTRSSMMRTHHGRNYQCIFDDHGQHELGWHLQQACQSR